MKYYSIIQDILENLESEAKVNLEKEITEESNKLFKIYYDNPNVKIEISNGAVQLYMTKPQMKRLIQGL